jgi:hypothetical protein
MDLGNPKVWCALTLVMGFKRPTSAKIKSPGTESVPGLMWGSNVNR